jgi:hypothetical protein
MNKTYTRRSQYNPEKDELLWQRAKGTGDDKLLIVQIYSYDGGIPKVQVAKHDVKKNQHLKLNRIPVDDLELALPLLAEALQVLKTGSFDKKERDFQKPMWSEDEGNEETQ